MFGFHPFATQSFSSAVPFLDILATTNALTSAISAAVMESRIITTTAGTVSSTIQSLPANSTFEHTSKIVVDDTDEIWVKAGGSADIDVIVSYLQQDN